MIELNWRTYEEIVTKVHKTEKYWVHTDQGKLLDTLCGNMAFIYGYSDQEIFNRMLEVQKKIAYLNFKHNEICEENDQLVKSICKAGNFSGLAWAVSGTDGVEAAIAINDLYWKNQNKHKPTVISFAPGYHGATYLCRIFRAEEEPFDRAHVINAPVWHTLEDRASLEERAISDIEKYLEENNHDGWGRVGAILIESVPWAQGIKPWSKSWWENIRNICDKYDINFIVDDVMGGFGKLGYMFSHQRYGVQPDIVALGKSLTGGYSPLSCACVNEKISTTVKDNWQYGHTWMPNMAGIGAALAVMDKFDQTEILKIEKRTIDLAEKFLAEGFITDYVVEGLLFHANLVKPLILDAFVKHGLTGGPDIKHSLCICVPAIADDEYFTELEYRLRETMIHEV